jgi:uncharacterized protein involved in response to NO
MIAILAALFAGNLVIHLDALGVLPAGSARRACSVAVDVVALVILIITGRVVPMFTRNATQSESIRSSPVLDLAAVTGMAGLALVDSVAPGLVAAGVLSGLVGLLALGRATHWGAWRSRREPLLWILHTGSAWLVLGLLLRAVATFVPALSGSLSTHAMTVGAIGSLTLGMMSRVSLGHTGRALVASSAMRWSFVAMTAAAAVRVLVPLAVPAWYSIALLVAGVLWCFAFATFLATSFHVLASPRLDGKPG